MLLYKYVVEQMQELSQMADKWIVYLLDDDTKLIKEEWQYISDNAFLLYNFSVSLWGNMCYTLGWIIRENLNGADRDAYAKGYRMYRENMDKWKRIRSIVEWKTGKIDHENGPAPSVPF